MQPIHYEFFIFRCKLYRCKLPMLRLSVRQADPPTRKRVTSATDLLPRPDPVGGQKWGAGFFTPPPPKRLVCLCNGMGYNTFTSVLEERQNPTASTQETCKILVTFDETRTSNPKRYKPWQALWVFTPAPPKWPAGTLFLTMSWDGPKIRPGSNFRIGSFGTLNT